MSAPLVMPSSGQNGFGRFVSRTSHPDTVNVALSASAGITGRGVFATSAFLRLAQDAFDRRQLRRPLAMTGGAGDRHVLELDAGHDAAKHQTATAHVSAADEVGREHQL